MNRLEKANNYIQHNKGKANNRPFYHFSPEIGWMNDPNGFSFYKGKYHLFYQYNPYDVVWDNMHWGHAMTNDFVKWEYLPVALANDKVYDMNGCFSGSAIEKDGKLFLIYTGHIDPNMGFDRDEPEIAQRQCVAFSDDGINFEKYKNNPVISEKQLPEGYLICDFRDPKVMEVDGVYYCVLAVRNTERRGEILMFKSNNLIDWTFHSSIYQSKYEENTLLECPDLFKIDNKDVLLFSEMPCDPKYQNEIQNSTSYVIGKMNFEKGIFVSEKKGRLDYGQTFYAPQSTEGKNKERLLIGWMHRWHQTTPPKEYGFNGMMSIPRRLSIKNNELLQEPFIELENYFKTIFNQLNIKLEETININGESAGYLKISISENTKKLLIELNKNEINSTCVEVDVENNAISIHSDYGNQESLTINDCFFDSDSEKILEFFIDQHSFELFTNSGEKVISFTAYDKQKGKDIKISGNVVELTEISYSVFKTEK